MYLSLYICFNFLMGRSLFLLCPTSSVCNLLFNFIISYLIVLFFKKKTKQFLNRWYIYIGTKNQNDKTYMVKKTLTPIPAPRPFLLCQYSHPPLYPSSSFLHRHKQIWVYILRFLFLTKKVFGFRVFLFLFLNFF